VLLIALAYILVVLTLLDLEPEWPLFHVQDHLGGTKPNYGYYCSYLYPRPWYWVERLRELVQRNLES
jgi:hypothetical protein